ncbi:4-carboxymuconolactone decarboxylase [Rhizobium sp. Root1203]|uniref:carboxymuconolactone decarboxylase family protein n=1 Tax=Rhizobium sp. Root1203 TaxID=1736427 RepID=UPI00070ABE2C|nr:carboxymuconolactone decarboxylase family protein [Rhizobium sp. Root1203]KQV32499.1 4-carboxymuconolactone decarboxylase [Rhizobium sp. Root1203]
MSTSHTHRPALTLDDVRSVSPALASYTQKTILDDLWKRTELSPRDRSIVTISALIARNQTVGMPYYINLALDSGVSPGEVSGAITHLAFYSGWSNAFAAVEIARDIFAERGILFDRLPAALPDLLPLDEEGESRRAAAVHASFGDISPGVVHYTAEILFKNLWLRPDLAPRDRSLVTVSALVAMGQVAQITYHLGRAMDNGLTREHASEALTQLAFHCGWPCVFSAMPVVKEVFASRRG